MGQKPNWKLMDDAESEYLPGSIADTWLFLLKAIIAVIGISIMIGFGSRWM